MRCARKRKHFCETCIPSITGRNVFNPLSRNQELLFTSLFSVAWIFSIFSVGILSWNKSSGIFFWPWSPDEHPQRRFLPSDDSLGVCVGPMGPSSAGFLTSSTPLSWTRWSCVQVPSETVKVAKTRPILWYIMGAWGFVLKMCDYGWNSDGSTQLRTNIWSWFWSDAGCPNY